MKFAKAPDPGWIPFLKVVLGYLMFMLLAILAAVIGLGKVQQDSSFGLQDILGGLLVIAGAFSQWAFGAGSKKEDND